MKSGANFVTFKVRQTLDTSSIKNKCEAKIQKEEL